MKVCEGVGSSQPSGKSCNQDVTPPYLPEQLNYFAGQARCSQDLLEFSYTTVVLHKYSLFRNWTPTQMELSHGLRKNVYSRAVLKSSRWKQPRELCRLMVYSDIDITQQIQMDSLQVHTTLWMARANMLSDISQTQELHMYAAIPIKVKFIVL